MIGKGQLGLCVWVDWKSIIQQLQTSVIMYEAQQFVEIQPDSK